MSAKSPPSLPTPRSSSLPDRTAEAVQELLALRAEKQRYQELQALLRQGLDNLKEQQEQAYQAEFRFRKMLKNITDISADVDNVFATMMDNFNRVVRYLRQPYLLTMKKRERLNYIDKKYEMWLRISIRHHYHAIEVLHKALDALMPKDDEIQPLDDPTLVP